MPLNEIDLNRAEAQQLYFPQTQATRAIQKKSLVTYEPAAVHAKEQRRKKRLLITYDENVISPENKRDDWLGLFDDQLDDEEELKRQKQQPKQVMTKRDEMAHRLVKRQLLKKAILEDENYDQRVLKKRKTKSFEMTPKILPSKKESIVKRRVNLDELADDSNVVFSENIRKRLFDKDEEYDQEYSIDSEPKKQRLIAKKPVYRKKADRKKAEQAELDKLAYEEWCKEYEDIASYPLVVECVDHDY